jgi:hypothetical protein
MITRTVQLRHSVERTSLPTHSPSSADKTATGKEGCSADSAAATLEADNPAEAVAEIELELDGTEEIAAS